MPADEFPHKPLDNQPSASPADVVKRMIDMLKTNEFVGVSTTDGVATTSIPLDDTDHPTTRIEPIVLEPKASLMSQPTGDKPAPETLKTELRIDNLAIEMNRAVEKTIVSAPPLREITAEPPWTLQQFFNGEIDLDLELTKRFPTMPMMAQIQFRTLGTTTGRRVATLTTQDGSASLIIDADVKTKVVQLSFTLGSMLTLRFALSELSDMDRTRWLELMRREQGGLAFLWGPNRWVGDYLICISRKHHTNFYAFSPHNFDAGIRLTPAVTQKLLDWLDEVWRALNDDQDLPPILTW